jgi:hypothetical protein
VLARNMIDRKYVKPCMMDILSSVRIGISRDISGI